MNPDIRCRGGHRTLNIESALRRKVETAEDDDDHDRMEKRRTLNIEVNGGLIFRRFVSPEL